MKKSQLKNMIKETILKEYGEGEFEVFTTEDGWDEQALNDIGVMDSIKEIEAVAYEIRNARRHSYAGFGDTPQELAQELIRLGDNLKDMGDAIMNRLDY